MTAVGQKLLIVSRPLCTALALGVVFFIGRQVDLQQVSPTQCSMSLPTEPRPHRRGFFHVHRLRPVAATVGNSRGEGGGGVTSRAAGSLG
jgi:hypothetical protein